MFTVKRAIIHLFCLFQSLIIALSSIGLSLNVHYCQGNIKSIGIYAPAEKCSGEMDITKCSNHLGEGFTKTPCCSNKQHSYQIGNADNSSNFINTQDIPIVTILQRAVDIPAGVCFSEGVLTFNGSDPPLVVKDLNILYDTFLI